MHRGMVNANGKRDVKFSLPKNPEMGEKKKTALIPAFSPFSAFGFHRWFVPPPFVFAFPLFRFPLFPQIRLIYQSGWSGPRRKELRGPSASPPSPRGRRCPQDG